MKHDDALHGLLADRCQSFGVTLPVGAADRLIALVGRIASEPQNLTRILDPAAAVDRHLADSLVAIGAGAIASNGHLIDIGSGAGFPGLALAIACPDLDVTLLEAEARKADWLRRASAGLPNVSVIHDRAEVLALRRRGGWSLATTRAVGSLPVVIELAAPLLSEPGRLIAWRGKRDAADEAAAAHAAPVVGFALDQIMPVFPFPDAERHLHVFRRVAQTPDRFPRRDGRAAHRPLA